MDDTDLLLSGPKANPELLRLRALVDAARAQLAELEAGFTIEKAKVEAMKARLFARLREHFQRRDRLWLVIDYRREYLESLVRQSEEEAGKIAQEYRQSARSMSRNMRRRRRRWRRSRNSLPGKPPR